MTKLTYTDHDGLIRTLPLGLLFSDLALNQTRRAAKRRRPR